MPKLTIGMAHYNDFDGVFFSIQALRLYQDMRDVEVLVIDNSPDTDAGKAVAQFVNGTLFARYIPFTRVIGAANAKGEVFREAQSDFVLCMDCHVMLVPGAVENLVRWYEDSPRCDDLITGPLIYDNLYDISTHFDLTWRGDMWGIWSRAWACKCGNHFSIPIAQADSTAHDLMDYDTIYSKCPVCGLTYPVVQYEGHESAFCEIGCKPLGLDYNDPPYEVPANGMGLFSCRKESWLGFNPDFRGFGGEEGYIHLKYRQAGRKCLNLSFLGWIHRFGRANPVTYPLSYWDRIRNYVVGRRELNLPYMDIHDHFVGLENKPIDEKSWQYLIEDPVGHADAPCSDCGSFAGNTVDEIFSWTESNPHNMGCHMRKFRELASKCRHVTAMVKQKEFDVTLLAGRPKVLRVYTSEPSNVHKHLATLANGIEYTSTAIDWLTLDDIEETDLLVIHSIHQAERLYAELSKFGRRVRRWILLRSTGAYGEAGEPNGPGLFPAMRKYIQENPKWSVIEHNKIDFGYTLLSCNPADKQKSYDKIIWSHAKTLAKHYLSGRTAKPQIIEARLSKCATCIYRTHNRCSICNCTLDEGDARAVWPDSFCSLGEWFEET